MSRHIGGAARGGSAETSDDQAGLEQAFRAALARWASGVAVVAVRDDLQVFAVTVTAFTSVAVDPPLVLTCLGPNAVIRPILATGSRFVVNILSAEQQRTATIFTDIGPLGRELFPKAGAPVLDGSMASLVCSVDAQHAASDHMIVVGRVHEVRLGGGGPPLLRYDRGWHRFEPTD